MRGAIFQEKVPILSVPAKNGKVLARLGPGSRVEVISKQDMFFEIKAKVDEKEVIGYTYAYLVVIE